VSSALAARDAKLPRAEDNVGIIAVAHSSRAGGFDASEDGTGRGTPLVPIAFSAKDYGADVGDTAPTLRAMGHAASHANGGGQIAIAIQERAISENPAAGPDGAGSRQDGAAYTLEARTVPQAVPSICAAATAARCRRVRTTRRTYAPRPAVRPAAMWRKRQTH
jgi:DNA (cytosine-5)-methyltransferase 1